MAERYVDTRYSKLDPQVEALRRPPSLASEKPARPALSSRGILDRIQDGWIMESICLFLSLGSFGGMFIVFARFNGKTLPTWPGGLTINAMISVLSTLSRVALLVPATNAISQIKWLRYTNRERPLHDLQMLDSASRGMVGSLACVYKRRGGLVPFISSAIFIAAFLLDAFTQQVLTYPVRQVQQAGAASVSRSISYSPPSALQNTIIADIYSGILAPNSTFVPSKLNCPTGDCTWPVYNQLGICAETVDVSSQVKIDCTLSMEDTDRIYAPVMGSDGSPYCAVTAPGPQQRDPSDFNQAQAFPTVRFNVEDVQIMSLAAGTNPKLFTPVPIRRDISPSAAGSAVNDGFEPSYQLVTPTGNGSYVASFYTVYKSSSSLLSNSDFTGFFMATQTTFSICSQSLQVSVVQGIPQVSTISTYTPENLFDNKIQDGSYGHYTFTAPGADETYYIEAQTMYNLGNSMVQILNSSQASNALYMDVYRDTNYSPPWMGSPSEDPPDARTWMPAHLEIVSDVGDGLATSLTRNIQSQANLTFSGYALQNENYIHVRWQWLSLHAAFMFMAWLLFLYAIIASHFGKLAYWKGSLWPLIFLLDERKKAEMDEMAGSPPSMADKRARRIHVKFA